MPEELRKQEQVHVIPFPDLLSQSLWSWWRIVALEHWHDIFWILIDQWSSNFGVHQNHLERWLKHRLPGPIPRVLIQCIWVGTWECASLTSSRGMADPISLGSHPEGLPWWLNGKESTCNSRDANQEIPRRRQWHPTPVPLPGKSHGWRSLVGCSPWGREESDTTERLHFYFSLSCIGEGNGNPLQCSCLENPRDGVASWAAVYGVAQSQTWLKRLSSNSRFHSWVRKIP